jgi:hypothetical protein
MFEFLKLPVLGKIILKRMTGNVVLSEVDALMYVMLSRGVNHMPYGELVGTTEHIVLHPRYSTNRGC